MPDVVDADARYGDAFERAQKNASKRIAERRAVTGLHRFGLVAAIVEPGLDGFDVELRSLQQEALPPRLVIAPRHVGSSGSPLRRQSR